MEKHTHSSEFMIPTRMPTCPIPCLESSPTSSHMLMPCMKTVSKQKYLFYLRATLRYKYVRQYSKVNLLGNSPKQFMGLSDVNCWKISQHHSSDNFPIKFYCFGQPSDLIHVMHSHLLILRCPGACEMQYVNSQQFMLIYQACIY